MEARAMRATMGIRSFILSSLLFDDDVV